MKTTTFDQLKAMLKSMSLSIFPRLRNMEKNIDEIKATIPTPEKEIIFTKGADGSYSCNIPHAELWEMDADIIGKNARVVIDNEVYAVRGASKKSESLYGDVIQLYADLNVGTYDLPGTFHRTLILSYFLSILDGTTAMIIPDEVSSLSNSHNGAAALNIPILRSNGVWHNGPADFLAYDSLNSVYTLKTMSEFTKGGAMVGDGLEVVDGVLRVKQAKSEILLSDVSTDKAYSIHVTNGEIILTESEATSGTSSSMTLIDTETQSPWSIYISNGELMIKEATA